MPVTDRRCCAPEPSPQRAPAAHHQHDQHVQQHRLPWRRDSKPQGAESDGASGSRQNKAETERHCSFATRETELSISLPAPRSSGDWAHLQICVKAISVLFHRLDRHQTLQIAEEFLDQFQVSLTAGQTWSCWSTDSTPPEGQVGQPRSPAGAGAAAGRRWYGCRPTPQLVVTGRRTQRRPEFR